MVINPLHQEPILSSFSTLKGCEESSSIQLSKLLNHLNVRQCYRQVDERQEPGHGVVPPDRDTVTQRSELRIFPRAGVNQRSLSADLIFTLTSQTTSTEFKHTRCKRMLPLMKRSRIGTALRRLLQQHALWSRH